MTYYALTFDGRSYSFDEKFLPNVERAMRDKTPIRFKGEMVTGSDLRRIEKRGSSDYGPHHGDLFTHVQEVFSLGTGKHTGFWADVTRVNMERKARKKRWLTNNDILPLRAKYPDMKAGDVMAIIEWTNES